MNPIKKIAGVVAGLCFSFNVSAQSDAPKKQDTLRFYNVHTKERITVIRAENDSISKEANVFMRDYRRKEPAKMDPKLFDQLADLQDEIRKHKPKLRVEFHVISAYRAEETNNGLRKAGGSQAKNSLHIQGKAMDIRVPGVSTVELRNFATCLNAGGVGYYGQDQFVHIDTGPVRYWPSRDYLKTLKCK